MPISDKRIDDDIEKKADFAKPILKHLRQLAHQSCPDAVETLKWSMPYFDYKGSVLCGMAAFKEHCVFLFHKARMMKDPQNILQVTERDAMGNFGKIKSLHDLPSDEILVAYIKEAAKLNEENMQLPPKKKSNAEVVLKTPEGFSAALKKNKKAQTVFENFTLGKKKDYIDWINEAKTEPTKQKRIDTAVEWIAEGKSRNWKYER